MHEFKVGDQSYRAGKMTARQQFHVSRRIAPLIGQIVALAPVMGGVAAARQEGEEGDTSEAVANAARQMEGVLVPFTRALAGMSDAECDYVLDNCLSVVQRLTGANGAGAYSDIWNPRARRMMFEDIDMMQMMQIAAEVLMDNLSGFFAIPLPGTPNPGLPAQRNSPA